MGVDHRLGQRRHVAIAEVEALARDRMDAVGGIADKRQARLDEAARHRQAEREGLRRVDHPHGAEAMAEAPLQFDGEGERIALDQPLGHFRRLRPHQRRLPAPLPA